MLQLRSARVFSFRPQAELMPRHPNCGRPGQSSGNPIDGIALAPTHSSNSKYDAVS